MFRKTLAVAAATLATAALTVAGTSPAGADVEYPTTGDTITYEFVSNHQINDSIYWYDADTESQRFPDEYDQRVKFNSSFKNENGHTMWLAKRTFTSRSTTQLVGGYVSADYEQSSQNYVRCATYVNGVQTSFEYATGKYATAYC